MACSQGLLQVCWLEHAHSSAATQWHKLSACSCFWLNVADQQHLPTFVLQKVSYCSRECQLKHRRQHKADCKPSDSASSTPATSVTAPQAASHPASLPASAASVPMLPAGWARRDSESAVSDQAENSSSASPQPPSVVVKINPTSVHLMSFLQRVRTGQPTGAEHGAASLNTPIPNVHGTDRFVCVSCCESASFDHCIRLLVHDIC